MSVNASQLAVALAWAKRLEALPSPQELVWLEQLQLHLLVFAGNPPMQELPPGEDKTFGVAAWNEKSPFHKQSLCHRHLRNASTA